MKKKLRKYLLGSQGLASTPTINPYTGFSPSTGLQEPSGVLGMSKPLDYENNKPKTQLAPSSTLLNKPSLSPTPTSAPYTGLNSKPTVSPAFTPTPSIASPQRYASASVKPEAGPPKTAFGATKTGLDQTKLQSSATNMAPKTNVGATAAGGVASGLNAIGTGIETYRGYNPVAPGPTSLYNKREQGMLKKINKERDAVTALSTTAGALGTAAGITAAIPVIGWGVGAGLAIGAAGTGIAAASTAASLDKQESNLGKRVNARVEREKKEAEGLRKTQEIETMMNSSNPLDIQNEMSGETDLMRGKYGGKMPTYKMGGPRSYQEPNAELERGEVIMRNGGRYEMVKGDRHEEGGEDKYLAPGDFVWSDHLKYKGKSMAELYLMVKNSPEKVNQLKDLQEDLASKEEPSEYNDLPQAKCGGLPQYKKGTPAAAAPTGVNSKAKTWFNEYGEYILPTLSAAGQIVNLALAKDPYENLSVPRAKKVGSNQQISLAYTNAQAELDANEAGAVDARESALYTGAGPGSTAIYQTIANQQAGLNSKAQNEANRINMSIAAEEARLNSDDKYRRESFNAGAENENAKLRYDKNVNQAAYKAATTASYGNVFAGIANDAQSFMRDKAVARSITRGTNIDSNRYAMNVEAIEKAARDEETANAAKANRDFSEDEYLKLRTKKIGEANTYISTRK